MQVHPQVHVQGLDEVRDLPRRSAVVLSGKGGVEVAVVHRRPAGRASTAGRFAASTRSTLKPRASPTTAKARWCSSTGALPGEEVQVTVGRKQEQLGAGRRWSRCAARVRSACVLLCPHFGLHPGACGGCKMQHLQSGRPGRHQAARAGGQALAPRQGQGRGADAPDRRARPPGYRYRARLSVRYVAEEGHGAGGLPRAQEPAFVADMQSCKILPRARSATMLMPLREPGRRAGRVDTAAADRARHRDATDEVDRAGAAPPGAAEPGRQRAAARLRRPSTACSGGCSPRGRTRCTRSTRPDQELHYTLPEFGVPMPFKPTDFTQVNHHINRVLVRPRAAPAGRAARTSACIDLVLRPGQLHAAAGHAGARGAGHRRQRGAGRTRARATPGATAWIGKTTFRRPQPVRDDAALTWSPTACSTAGSIDPPREGALALVQGAGGSDQEPSLAPGCRRERIVYVSLRPVHAGARRRACWSTWAGYRCTRPVRSTCSRTRRTSNRSRSSSAIPTRRRASRAARWRPTSWRMSWPAPMHRRWQMRARTHRHLRALS